MNSICHGTLWNPLKTHWKKNYQSMGKPSINGDFPVIFPHQKTIKKTLNNQSKIHQSIIIHLSTYQFCHGTLVEPTQNPLEKTNQNSSKSPRPLRLRWLRPRPRCHLRLAIAAPRSLAEQTGTLEGYVQTWRSMVNHGGVQILWLWKIHFIGGCPIETPISSGFNTMTVR